jgi:hypothetical protein
VQGDGNLVIVPPSVVRDKDARQSKSFSERRNSGKGAYTYVRRTPVAECPDLIKRRGTPAQVAAAAREPVQAYTDKPVTAPEAPQAREHLDAATRTIRACDQLGQQRTTLLMQSGVVGWFVGAGLLQGRTAFAELQQAGLSMANLRGDDPWTEPEVTRVVVEGLCQGEGDWRGKRGRGLSSLAQAFNRRCGIERGEGKRLRIWVFPEGGKRPKPIRSWSDHKDRDHMQISRRLAALVPEFKGKVKVRIPSGEKKPLSVALLEMRSKALRKLPPEQTPRDTVPIDEPLAPEPPKEWAP